MADILNYTPNAYQVVIPSLVTTNGLLGVLKAENFDRYINRIVLNSSGLSASDLSTPSTWTGTQSQTMVVDVLLGAGGGISGQLDRTVLGELNVAEYVIPLLLPKNTDFYLYYELLLKTSASKVSASIGLST